MKTKASKYVFRICLTAMFAALFYVLSLVTIRTPITNITFASFPIVVAAILFGPVEAGAAAFLGEFLQQMLAYGFGPTTLLWILPPVARGLIIGFASLWFRKKGSFIERKYVVCYVWCMVGAVATTLLNTVVQFIDCKVFKYPMPYAWASLPARFIIGIVMSVVITTVAIPVCNKLRKQAMKLIK